MKNTPRWDIFCAVVDNYGDIGVCWRLARQLAIEYGFQVRLWVDDLTPLASVRPAVDPALLAQRVDGVDLRYWPESFPSIDAADVADVVIEAFACQLPESYLLAMASRNPGPVWINLEYLSAEAWVEGSHGLASPHPGLPLTKYFFFPGFTGKTGGLIRESAYERRRATFDEAAFRNRQNLPPKRSRELTLSLFGYENTALSALLNAWTHSPHPVTCIVPESRLLPGVQTFFNQQCTTMQSGGLTVHAIPFLPQEEYDELLWACDINFVRGEDSFVRAQWAGKPFVWHIYPQAEAAHLIKLKAFLARYSAGLPSRAARALQQFWQVWNDGADPGSAWLEFAEMLPELDRHGQRWARQILASGDLAENLLRFSRKIAPK